MSTEEMPVLTSYEVYQMDGRPYKCKCGEEGWKLRFEMPHVIVTCNACGTEMAIKPRRDEHCGCFAPSNGEQDHEMDDDGICEPMRRTAWLKTLTDEQWNEAQLRGDIGWLEAVVHGRPFDHEASEKRNEEAQRKREQTDSNESAD